MGKVDVLNASDPQREAFLKVWQLHAGDTFDGTYARSFLLQHGHSLPQLDGYSATYKQIDHLDSHVVDLVVTIQKGGPLRLVIQ